MFGLQQPTSYSRLGLPQVLEYSSTHSSSNYSSNFFTTRLLAFIFPVANPHFRLTFLQPIDELLKFMNIHVDGVLVQGPDLRAPGTLTRHPLFVIGSLY